MPLTMEERERRAYANGHTKIAALLGQAIDSKDQKITELEEEVQSLEEEIGRLEKALIAAENDVIGEYL